MNTQPKAYSKSSGTGYFNPVPLDAAVFDSFPTSDAFAAQNDKTANEYGLRPLQVMGYAPRSAI